MIDPVYYASFSHILAALIAGGLIGLERSHQGRAAGFRTHALVCTASSLLMQLTLFQLTLIPGIPIEAVRIDPTRMAQGIMTGIGFLGAGVIMKDNMNIRGLTTAASIWITAAIGIMFGVGLYTIAIFCTALTLGALSLFRWLEAVMPTQHYAKLRVRTKTSDHMTLEELQDLIADHSCSASSPGYELEEGGKYFRYELTVRTRDTTNFRRLADALTALKKSPEFQIHPTSE
jgi:putative Mg2+ transporter-C (MgtC) family protein